MFYYFYDLKIVKYLFIDADMLLFTYKVKHYHHYSMIEPWKCFADFP